MQRSRGENIFNVFNIIILGAVGLLAVYPFVYILNLSISTTAAASKAGLHILPDFHEITLASYVMVLKNHDILVGYMNTLFRTVVGTVLTLLAVCVTAYPLARPDLPLRRTTTFLITFTMIFTGGLVPSFLLITKLGLYDSRWALILPMLLTAFNVIVVKNFFQSIPESLAEAAMIDGAGPWKTLFSIYIPLSKPVLATVGLWTAVLHWNHWFDALLYIDSDAKQVLQIFLQRVVVENNTALIEMGVVNPDLLAFTPETIKAATVIVTILPILLVYPFIQRFFVKGIMLGSVKG